MGDEERASYEQKETFLLYGGKVKLEYHDKKHKYVAVEEDGRVIDAPSITTVLGVINKPALVQWAVNQAIQHLRSCLYGSPELSYEDIDRFLDEAKFAHWRVKQEAADIGSEAHQWLEDYWFARMTGSPPPALPDHELVRNCCLAAKKWIDGQVIEPLIIEKPVYSRIHRVAGRLDKLARVNGKLSIVDWKSSTGLWPEYYLQTAAYAKIYEEETGEAIECRWLIKLGKYDGEFKAVCIETGLQEDYDAFLAALTVKRRIAELERLKQ